MTPQPKQEYRITGKMLENIENKAGGCMIPEEWLSEIRSNPIAPAMPDSDVIYDLNVTEWMLVEFCEWFCGHNCDEEPPCSITVSCLRERLEGIKKQMLSHPEYLKKWIEMRQDDINLQTWRYEHDAAIRKEEREKVLGDIAQYIQKHSHVSTYMPLWVVTKGPLIEFIKSLRSSTSTPRRDQP